MFAPWSHCYTNIIFCLQASNSDSVNPIGLAWMSGFLEISVKESQFILCNVLLILYFSWVPPGTVIGDAGIEVPPHQYRWIIH